MYKRDSSKKHLGCLGEKIAGDYLKEKGYQIIDRNFQIWGGELDIVAKDIETNEIVFIEVKARKSEYWQELDEVISYSKKRFIRRAVLRFLCKYDLEDENWRVDYVCILISNGEARKIEHFEAVD